MTGNQKLDKIILGLSAVVTLGSAALVFYSHTQIKPPATDQAAEAQALLDKAQHDNMIKPFLLKQLVVNIPGRGQRLRYLEAEIGVLPFEESSHEIFKNNVHLFQNALVLIAADMDPDELMSVTGKLLLESRIKKKVNEELGKPLIKRIYFSKFTIQ
jgi:flagellar FliL protein